MKVTITIAAAVLALTLPPTAHAVLFQTGDVFAGVASGNVNHYSSTGTLKATYNIGASGFTTGMAFDGSGNLYVTGFSASTLAKFDNSGTLLNANFAAGLSTPESVVFDTSGNFYVGNLGNGIRKYDSAGAYQGSVVGGRVDWIDLSADQSTLIYSTEGRTVYSVSNALPGVPNANFAALPGDGEAYALRYLSDGGILIADGDNIKRLNSAGVVTQTYDTATENAWFSLNLDPDGTSFWSGDFATSGVYKFDIATGTQLANFSTGTGSSSFFGLAVYGEKTAGGPPPSGVPDTGTTLSLLGLALAGLAAIRRRVC